LTLFVLGVLFRLLGTVPNNTFGNLSGKGFIMCTGKTFLLTAIVLIMASVADAGLVLTVNGFDTSMPIDVKTDDDIIIAVAGQTDEQKESYSVTCEMGGKLTPLPEPNSLTEKPKEGDYLFTFEDEELGLAMVNLTVGDVLDYQLILFKIPDANTIIFGIDSDAVQVEPEPEPEPEPKLQPTTTPYSHLKIKPRQEKEKVLRICPQVVKRSELTIPDANDKGRTFSTHDGSVALSKDGGVIDVTSDITTNTLWTADNVYHVLNPIDVNNALLVIEPGTMVAFAAGTDAGIRIINGGALMSRGTPGNEIVYTSDATYPNYEDYYCPIYITETASLATQVKYSIVEWAYAGVVVLDRKLETNIENNYFVNCVFGVVEYGLDHTNITNNLFYGSGYGAIEIYMFVDGEKYLQYGDIQENPTVYLETQYFRNGSHTVKIISQDANNIVYCSEIVDVNFSNPVSLLIMDESFVPSEDFHIMALGSGDYDISVYDIVNETTSYSGISTGQINVTIPAAAFPEEYGAYDFKMAPQGDPDNPLFNFLIRRKFGYEDLYGSGAKDGGDWIMKMVVSIGDKKLEKDKKKCWRAALRAGVKKGFSPGVVVPSDGDHWWECLSLALTFDHCKIWYHVGHGNYKTIWPWNPERTFISSPSGKIFSYLKKDYDPNHVPPNYEKVWGYENCHSIAELGQVDTDKMIWVQINACYSFRNPDFMQMIGTPNYDPLGLGIQVYIGWHDSVLVHDILGAYNQFEYDYWKYLRQGYNLHDAVDYALPPVGRTIIEQNFTWYGANGEYVWFRYPAIN
jgi:hypothetical protein